VLPWQGRGCVWTDWALSLQYSSVLNLPGQLPPLLCPSLSSHWYLLCLVSREIKCSWAISPALTLCRTYLCIHCNKAGLREAHLFLVRERVVSGMVHTSCSRSPSCAPLHHVHLIPAEMDSFIDSLDHSLSLTHSLTHQTSTPGSESVLKPRSTKSVPTLN
jgi:hypothetical protein